jgi:hypothetical protein
MAITVLSIRTFVACRMFENCLHNTLCLTFSFPTYITVKWSGSWFVLLVTYCDSDQIEERNVSGEVCSASTENNRYWYWVLDKTYEWSMPQTFYPGKEYQYPFYRRLFRPKCQSGRVWNISPPTGSDPRTIQPLAIRYTEYYEVYSCPIIDTKYVHFMCISGTLCFPRLTYLRTYLLT